MNNNIKFIDKKAISAIFLIFVIILISTNIAHARYLKKLVVEPLSNPLDWKKKFNPGEAFSHMLDKSLADSGKFQMVQSVKIEQKVKMTSMLDTEGSVKEEKLEVVTPESSADDEVIEAVVKEKNPDVVKEEKLDLSNSEKLNNVALSKEISLYNNPSSQFKIRGRIIIFIPNTNSRNKNQPKIKIPRRKETAKVKADIELINLRTGRSLAKKLFETASDEGRVVFNFDLKTNDYETIEFKSSSIGKALWKLNNLIQAFIIHTLNNVPLEGDIIFVDKENKTVMVNLGKTNGLNVQDVFMVFSMQTGFNDPLNQSDLGDQYTRKGVIKIIEVQGRFSRAQITAGIDLSPGDLVIP